MKYRELSGNKFDIVQSYSNLGLILFRNGHQNEALDFLYKALSMCDEIKDFRQKASTLHYLGQVYNQQKDYQRELRSSIEALDLYQKYGTPREISSGYNNLGSLYQTLEKYDSSFYFHEKALALRRELNYKYGIANSLNNIGNLYKELKQFDKAIMSFQEAKEIWDESEDLESLSTLCGNLASTFKAMNVVDSTFKYANLGYLYSKEVISLEDVQKNSDLLSWAYEQKGDLANALLYFKEFHAASDSLYNDQTRRNAERQTLNFEFESKASKLKADQEMKDAISVAKLEDQKLIRNISFAAGFLAILLAVVAFNRSRIKQRAAKKLEEQNKLIEAARAKAEQSEKTKQQFLANMSHEVRTPMNAIIGMSKLLQDRHHDEKSNQYINAIRHSSENLLVVLNDILDISKLESRKMQLEEAVFDLRNELQFLHQIFVTRAEEKGLTLESNIHSTVPRYVKGDSGRLNQVLNNLLNNVIKFTEKGSVSVDVSMINSIFGYTTSDTRAETIQLNFRIKDSGIGIPTDKLASVFESFRQANASDSRKYGGTGLGLSIAKDLVELMGGSITVESSEGKG